MSPIEQAKAQWDSLPGNESFEVLCNWCAHHGYVYAGRDAFVVARAWRLDAGLFDEVTNPDTWFVFMASAHPATSVQRFMDLAPFPLPNVAFHRRGKLRSYNWAHLRSKLYDQNLPTSGT